MNSFFRFVMVGLLVACLCPLAAAQNILSESFDTDVADATAFAAAYPGMEVVAIDQTAGGNQVIPGIVSVVGGVLNSAQTGPPASVSVNDDYTYVQSIQSFTNVQKVTGQVGQITGSGCCTAGIAVGNRVFGMFFGHTEMRVDVKQLTPTENSIVGQARTTSASIPLNQLVDFEINVDHNAQTVLVTIAGHPFTDLSPFTFADLEDNTGDPFTPDGPVGFALTDNTSSAIYDNLNVVVPEPATLSLVGMAAGLMLLARRRRS